jgi:PPOX class probable FMN-dependent enzyme
MQKIESIAELEAIYGPPSERSLTKVTPVLTPAYRRWIEASRFCILSTVGPDGTDATPRGDDGPVVRIVDETTLWLPDWKGNNRLDALRNIVEDGRVSLMFFVHGNTTVVRVNGTAEITADTGATQTFSQNGRHPKTICVVRVGEAYFQCAKALMRARLWHAAPGTEALPTAGDFLKEQDATFDADGYDTGYEEYAKPRMW